MSTSQIIVLSIAFLALIVSGFISGSEIAFFSLSPKGDEEEIDEMPVADTVRRLLANPEKLLATILIANNLVNVTIVILCSFALSPLFDQMPEWQSFLLQTVLLTFLILLFGEIIPKLYADVYPLNWVRHAAPTMKGIVALLSPFANILARGSGIVNRVVTKQAVNISADELSQALEITDVKAEDEKEMLEGILRFGDTNASEIMTSRMDITDIDYEWNFQEVMKKVIESGYSRLPVVGDSRDDIKGILYSRDLLPHRNEGSDFDWHQLVREPYFVPESRNLDDLMEDFRKLKIHMAVVVDEYGGTQGIVTLEDVLEEIVGDINDEYDEDEKTYQRLADNTFVFEGKTLLTDFFRITDLDENDYEEVTAECETLAGMLLAIKGDFPKPKEPLVYGRCRFLILDITGHRISSVRVKVMPEEQ
ncbi:MAG: gliding motility-associated protein GldE [Muribaculaceae bacterium]|nr:gliding motility-associated protein GldE [Muribaculaceae bacterium]